MTKRRKRSAEQTLRVGQELTLKVAREQQQNLLASLDASQTLRLDLSGVTELDTAGVQLLLVAQRYAQKAGKTLHLDSASPAVREVLGMLRLDTYLLGASASAEQP